MRIFVTREAHLHKTEMRKHDQHLLHNPINVQAHICFGGRVVPAMVIKSADRIAWVAKLLGLWLYEIPLPLSSVVH